MEFSSKPHLLAVPFPVPGHVNPLMNLCYRIAAEGIRVTFVTPDSKHASTVKEEVGIPLTFVSFPDGLENDTETMKRVMTGRLSELVERTNLGENNEPITAVLADATVGWVLEVAEKIGAQQFAFWNAAPRGLACLSSLPGLNEGAAVNRDGSIAEKIQLDNQSSWKVWTDKMMANMGIDTLKRMQSVKSILCNAFYDLDLSSCKLVPKMLPVGPLKSLSTSRRISLEDTSCLEWLDRQPTKSVIYVAFGGTGVLSQNQFDELALGLELAGQPFLWVVRSNLVDGSSVPYPKGFLERVADSGKIVEWAPQEKLLAHPATACFLSHCGWNSILEGISFGVPFLCWPHFGEQFFHQDYISDILRVGLKLDVDENGVRSRKEISTKIQMLLSNFDIKANALKLKNLSEQGISKEGSSYHNLQIFINQLKQ